MKIYMDCCCFNRPFDDQSNPIVHLEAESIKIILFLCERGSFELISSEVLRFEIEKIPNILRREKLKVLEQVASKCIKIDSIIEKRAKYFEKKGLQAFDALHLACAEKGADLILTVDKQFLRKGSNITDLKIKINNPLNWIKEVFDEKSS